MIRSRDKKHWYMAAVKITFVIPAEPDLGIPNTMGYREFNVLITPERKRISHKEIEDIRNLSLIKLREQYKVESDKVADFVIHSIMYLGIQSEAEYFASVI